MRYLAIDYGGRRTGLAVADGETRIAIPFSVIEAANNEDRLAGLRRAVDELGPDALVLGLPLNMDGSEGPAAKTVRTFAALIGEHFGLPVHFIDERLTSHDAEGRLGEAGLTGRRRKARRDAVAAAVFLRDFLVNQEQS